jgi:integrase
MNLKDIEKKVWDRYWKKSKGAKSMSSRLGGVIDFFGPSMKIEDIQQTDLDTLIDQCYSIGNTPATINRKLSVFSKIQQYAYDRGYMDKLLKLEYQKEAPGRIRFLSEDEERTLLRLMPKHIANFIRVMLDTGMRPSEIRGLSTQTINDGWVVLSNTKNSVTRRIPLTQRASGILGNIDTLDGIRTVRPALLNYTWNRIKIHMGITDPEFVPYACRHTFASRLIQKGVEITTIMKLMGHKNIQMTMRYAHLAPANLQEAINLLEE